MSFHSERVLLLMANKTILVVDDSITQVATIKYVLNNAGFNVLTGSDGNEGLKVLNNVISNNKLIHLIISDINMEGMDGITFIKEVRKNEKFKFIPIIVLTTEGDEEVKQKGKSAGASAWIVKPFQPDQLLLLINKFLPEGR
jgi:two-component system chemotaxis response regulator CheY